MTTFWGVRNGTGWGVGNGTAVMIATLRFGDGNRPRMTRVGGGGSVCSRKVLAPETEAALESDDDKAVGSGAPPHPPTPLVRGEPEQQRCPKRHRTGID